MIKDKKEIDKCKCPILAGNIVFNAMMLLDDASYINKRVNTEVLKMRLNLYLDGFNKNCPKAERHISIEEMKKRIDKISPTEPITEQGKDIIIGLEAANDMAVDYIDVKDPLDLL